MNILIFLIKKIVVSICLIYTVDLLISSVGYVIPINYISILFVTFLGMPGIIGLVCLNKFM